MGVHKYPTKAIVCTARAGFITKGIWKDFFFEGGTVSHRNRVWAELVKRKYFLPYPNRRISDVLVLNTRNEKLMMGFDDDTASPPVERNIKHDETLLRGVLELDRQGLVDHWTIEAELKSVGLQAYNLGNQGGKDKYPDALLYLKDLRDEGRVAVEMELTQKDKHRYKSIVSSYSFVKALRMVLFVVANPNIRRAIEEAAEQVYFPANDGKIAFMKLQDWEKNPVTAPIEFDLRTGSFMDYGKIPFASWVAGRGQILAS